jgi:hypothetical protein
MRLCLAVASRDAGFAVLDGVAGFAWGDSVFSVTVSVVAALAVVFATGATGALFGGSTFATGLFSTTTAIFAAGAALIAPSGT